MQRRAFLSLSTAGLLAACGPRVPVAEERIIGGIPESQIVPGYGLLEDGGYTLPPVPPGYLQGVNKRAYVPYRGTEAVGSIEVDMHAKFLYWIEPGGMAWRYPIAAGREGRGMRGTTSVGRKAEWPGWTPTANMIRSEPEVYGQFAGGVPGGLASPLGARALYLYRGGRDTFYRIHGTNDLSSIGNSGSAGCIRLFNHDAIDLYDRVPNGTSVHIRTYEDSVAIEGEAMANRGVELPPYTINEQDLYAGLGGQRPPVPEAMLPDTLIGQPLAPLAVAPGEAGLPVMAPPGAVPGVEMVGAGFAPRT